MNQLEIEESILINDTKEIEDPGLFHGKMGICIYFYLLGRKVNNKEYTEYADSLLDDIFKKASECTQPNFESGVAGIGWGISMLAQQKFVDANLDDVLGDVDNAILKAVTGEIPQNTSLGNGLTGYLFYLTKRLEPTSYEREPLSYALNKELFILVINKMEQSICKSLPPISKDIMFDMLGDLPMLIHVLREAYSLNIYNRKIERIILQIVPYMETNFASLHTNRLLLACELKYLQRGMQSQNRQMERLIEILFFSVDFEQLQYEVGDQQSIRNGIFGLKLLLHRLLQVLSISNPYYEKAEHILQSLPDISEDQLEESAAVPSRKFGIAEGIVGVKLVDLLYGKI